MVYDELVKLMGETNDALNLAAQPPAVILLAGLQGSGKTTTAGKLARWLKLEQKKKVLLASCDVYRPAAIEQLATLAQQLGGGLLSRRRSARSRSTSRERALDYARKHYHDVLIVDTAGRLAIDEEMMQRDRASCTRR